MLERFWKLWVPAGQPITFNFPSYSVTLTPAGEDPLCFKLDDSAWVSEDGSGSVVDIVNHLIDALANELGPQNPSELTWYARTSLLKSDMPNSGEELQARITVDQARTVGEAVVKQLNAIESTPSQNTNRKLFAVSALSRIGAQFTHLGAPHVISALLEPLIEDDRSGDLRLCGTPMMDLREAGSEQLLWMEARYRCVNRILVADLDQLIASMTKPDHDKWHSLRDRADHLYSSVLEEDVREAHVRYKVRRDRWAIASTAAWIHSACARACEEPGSDEYLAGHRRAVEAVRSARSFAEPHELAREQNQVAQFQLPVWLYQSPSRGSFWKLVGGLIESNSPRNQGPRPYDLMAQSLLLAVLRRDNRLTENTDLTEADIDHAISLLHEGGLTAEAVREQLQLVTASDNGSYAAALACGYHALAEPEAWLAPDDEEATHSLDEALRRFTAQGSSDVLRVVGVKFWHALRGAQSLCSRYPDRVDRNRVPDALRHIKIAGTDDSNPGRSALTGVFSIPY